MPIRINLLSEAQAAEELRRKDPVKRAMLGAVGVVLLVFAVALYFVWVGMQRANELIAIKGEWSSLEKDFNKVNEASKLTGDMEKNIERLFEYSTNRFLWGSFLNALSRVSTNSFMTNLVMESIQSDPGISLVPPAQKTLANGNKVTIPGGIREKIRVSIKYRDYGQETENVNKLLTVLANDVYFKEILEPGEKGVSIVDTASRAKEDITFTPPRKYLTADVLLQFNEKLR